jgi:hypothetical protein
MQSLNGVWRWLRDQVASAAGHNPRRRRHEFTRPLSTFAAQVEKLESRELLTVTFHGGTVIPNVANQNVFLGSDWTTSHLNNQQAGQFDQEMATLVNSKFMDGLTLAGYNVYRGTSTKGVFDNLTLDKTFDPNTQTGGISDTQIQGFLQGLITGKQVQQPNSNTLYTVYVEPGVLISLQPGVNSNNTFLGYHSAFTGTTAGGASLEIHYSVISYPNFPNVTFLSQGFSSSINDMFKVSAHELAEAITDPQAFTASTGGWFDDNLGEIGDITNFGFNQVFQGYEIQAISNQQDLPINFNGVKVTLTAPTNLNLTKLPTAGTATLSWTGVALGEGYRVFSVSGTTRTLLGTTDASTFSLKLTGLTAGTSKTFIVEAFDGPSIADSKPATLVVPAAGAAPVKGAASSLSNLSGPVSSLSHSTASSVVQWFDGTEDRRHRG